MNPINRSLLRAKIGAIIGFSHQLLNTLEYYQYCYPGEDLPDEDQYVLSKNLEEYDRYLALLSEAIRQDKQDDLDTKEFMDNLKEETEKENDTLIKTPESE